MIVAVGATVTLDGTGSSDPDGDGLTFRWRLIARPADSAAALSSAETVAPALRVDRVGIFQVELVVDDGKNTSTPDVVQIIAQALPAGTTLTTVQVTDTSGTARQDIDFTFGWVFAPGQVLAGKTLAARDSAGAPVPLQVDARARHADGSLRHAVLTARLPSLGALQTVPVEIVTADTPLPGAPVALADLLGRSFEVEVIVTTGGTVYRASARTLLQAAAPDPWLQGPLASEWLVHGPLVSDAGASHPHLSVRLEVRASAGNGPIRVGVTVENTWAYAEAPQNYTTGVDVRVNGASAFQHPAINHYSHSRWRKVFFVGDTPAVHLRHDVRALIRSGAVPSYDTAVVPTETVLARMKTRWDGMDTGPMTTGFTLPAMPTTGGRPDIGLLPAWAAVYLLSMDTRAEQVMLGTGELAGTFPIHYRDQDTGRPVTLDDYPYMTLLGHPGDTVNPATGRSESFPACAGDCSTPTHPDSPHQPSLAYVPYLITGDAYFLDELHFWANWNMLQHNPYYREFQAGLVKPDQTRGQAWSLRSLGQAAYITPDDHPLKPYFTGKLANNIAWYTEQYVGGAQANALGVITNGYTLGYNDGRGLAPWQDDFFTSAIGHLVAMGFADATPLLAYKAIFPRERMVGDGFCWISGAIYSLNVRENAQSPLYATIAEAYAASVAPEIAPLPCAGPEMAAAFSLQVGEMTGYSASATGYPSNMQPALAAAVDSGVAGAEAAWAQFVARTVKPDDSAEPQFAIIPRSHQP